MNTNRKLGLKENWKQFSLLVLVNAFVGGMVGLERSIFPEFASEKFGLSSNTAILSFIVAFGISKALSNYFTGRLANKFGRKNLLVFGWLMALPIPFILIYASHWNWVVFANVLLGVSQGFAWSSTVVMKIDLVGPKNRGFAMGLNEFAGYFSIGLITFVTGLIAEKYGVLTYPFYLGIGISVVGLLLSIFFIRDTRDFVHIESKTETTEEASNVFLETSFKNKSLSAVTQAGMVNNLNDGMIWGLLPILLLTLSIETDKIAIAAAVYPTVWGLGQLFTGRMADVYSKKRMLFFGMFIQGLAILILPFTSSYTLIVIVAAILGLGTALVYPTFLAAISEITSAKQRAESIGVFRLWRDLGYAFGAILSGLVADLFGLDVSIALIGGITILSSLVIAGRYEK